MQPGRESAVLISNGCHVEDLSLDQLDTRLRRQQADLRHPEILLDCEAMAADEIGLHYGIHGIPGTC